MKVYGLTFGRDYDDYNAPLEFEEYGLFSTFEKAFEKQVSLNKERFEEAETDYYCSVVEGIFEAGYSEDEYPENDTILAKAEEDEDWTRFAIELEKHLIRIENVGAEAFSKAINTQMTYPPFGYFRVTEIELHE